MCGLKFEFNEGSALYRVWSDLSAIEAFEVVFVYLVVYVSRPSGKQQQNCFKLSLNYPYIVRKHGHSIKLGLGRFCTLFISSFRLVPHVPSTVKNGHTQCPFLSTLHKISLFRYKNINIIQVRCHKSYQFEMQSIAYRCSFIFFTSFSPLISHKAFNAFFFAM